MSKVKSVIFQNATIRKIWHEEEWWFVIYDVIKALTDSSDVKQYLKRMRHRDKPLADNWTNIALLLTVETAGGVQNISCANREGIFRIIQSISSPKAEPFKRWLANVGQERIEEEENPAQAIERIKDTYRRKGYDEEWINARLRSIILRQQLTEEWQKRGVKEGSEYAALTNEISKGTFDMTVAEHKKLKGLKKENLRDHMSNLELIFNMLGEETTRQIAINNDAKGLAENKEAAKEGGKMAGDSRKRLESKTGLKVITEGNYLHLKERGGDKKLF